MWRIIHAAAALVCGFCLWPLSVCSTIQHSPIFQAPCCFNFSFIFWRFPLSFLFLRNVACRTCLLPCVGWEWLGVLRGDQRVIAAEAPRMDGILKRAVCPLSPRAAVEKSSRTLRSCHKSLLLTSGGYTWVHPGLIDHGWGTHWSPAGLRCLLHFDFDLLVCGHMEEGVLTRALLRGDAELLCCTREPPWKVRCAL